MQHIERLAPALTAADFEVVVARVGGSRQAIGQRCQSDGTCG
jgi:hypothetical protein